MTSWMMRTASSRARVRHGSCICAADSRIDARLSENLVDALCTRASIFACRRTSVMSVARSGGATGAFANDSEVPTASCGCGFGGEPSFSLSSRSSATFFSVESASEDDTAGACDLRLLNRNAPSKIDAFLRVPPWSARSRVPPLRERAASATASLARSVSLLEVGTGRTRGPSSRAWSEAGLVVHGRGGVGGLRAVGLSDDRAGWARAGWLGVDRRCVGLSGETWGYGSWGRGRCRGFE